jgi:hypothetical protein
MSINERFTQSFTKNPGVWILAGLLAFSIFSHYRTGVKFTNVCETILMLEEGYFDLETSQKYHATGIDLDAIMVEAKKHEELMKSNTQEGRAYRWWRKHSQFLSKVCGNRLADPNPRDDY